MNSTLRYAIDFFFDFIGFLKTVHPFPPVELLGGFDVSLYHLLVAFSFVSIGFDILLGGSSDDKDNSK